MISSILDDLSRQLHRVVTLPAAISRLADELGAQVVPDDKPESWLLPSFRRLSGPIKSVDNLVDSHGVNAFLVPVIGQDKPYLVVDKQNQSDYDDIVALKISQEEARQAGYRAMQFNFVVSTNEGAVALWKRLGFSIVGTLPDAFRHRTLGFVDVLYVMYRELDDIVV